MSLRRRSALALSCALGCLPAAVPAPASAAVSITRFSVTPSTTQAGAHAALTVGVAFGAAPASDDVRDVTLRLAPGLIADPLAAARCAAADFSADRCDPGSRVGSVRVRVATFLGSLDAAGDVHSLAPAAEELARFGVWLRPTPQLARQRLTIAARLARDEGNGVEVVLRDVPRTVDAIAGVSELPIRLEAVTLTLEPAVGGRPFVRNPTSCAPAVSRVTAGSWQEPDAVSSQVSAFTPTRCDEQPFAARLAMSIGAAGRTAEGTGPPLAIALSTPPRQAGLRRLELSLPPHVGPSLAVATRACLPEALAAGGCSPQSRIGTASATSPFLPTPLSGSVLLAVDPNGLPGLVVAFGGPPALQLEGTARVVRSRIRVAFDALPDLPLTRLTLRIAGGREGLLRAKRDLCPRRGTVAATAVLTSHGGQSLTFGQRVVSGCPRAGGRRR
jgi:hypothetical protein